MKEYIEKQNTKKEYTAPQMDVVSCDVQRFLCGSDEEVPTSLDIEVDD